MDKVQLHSDPEFSSGVPAGRKVNSKLTGLSFAMIDTHFFHLIFHLPSLHWKKEKPSSISNRKSPPMLRLR